MTLYERARAFIYRNARPLDLARWQFHFEQGGAQAVLAALAAYQNPDGGFGHALEPDAWNPRSTPIQTWAATEILYEIGFEDARHPIVAGIMRYLESGRDFSGHFWYNCVPGNNDYPHAPWWSAEDDGAGSGSYNPTACLAGFILRFSEPGSDVHRLGHRLAGEAVAALLALGHEDDMHTLSCYIRLLAYARAAGTEDLNLPALGDKLREQADRCITRDTAAWESGYVCRPSRFISTPHSAFYPGNAGIAQFECDFIRRTQQEDGAWPVPWRWKDYPEAWAVSKNWWRAGGVIENLLFLRGMGQQFDPSFTQNLLSIDKK